MKRKTLIVGALLGSLALSGCAGGDSYEPMEIGAAPEWAANPVDLGEHLGTTHTDSWQIDIFQVGTTVAVSDSIWEDEDTGENLLPKGSDIVVVNYVYTNISDETQYVQLSVGDATVKHDDFDYLGGMPSADDQDHFDEFELFDGVVSEEVMLAHEGSLSTFVTEIAPGESAAEPMAFEYLPGTEMTIQFRIPLTDSSGQPDFSNAEESPNDFAVTIL